MKKLLPLLFLFLCFLAPYGFYLPEFKFAGSRFAECPELWCCSNRTYSKSSPLNYRGPNLISKLSDPEDQKICLGDAFGDLNGTYIVMRYCALIMYHQDKVIWSSTQHYSCYPGLSKHNKKCALFVQRDGNLAFYGEKDSYACPFFGLFHESQIDFSPMQTELRVRDQQVQIVQTFTNGTQRIFYADANHQEFVEDLGEPIKVADKVLVKSHQDNDMTVLRRNEYIGDLNETHLIFQTNCCLELRNKNKIIWSFASPRKHRMNCVLNIIFTNELAISTNPPSGSAPLMNNSKERHLYIMQSKITFEEDQFVFIQTLKNGSEIIYDTAFGSLQLRNSKQITEQVAEHTITVKEYGKQFSLQRMEYIGDLAGLHLILEQNCNLKLKNGKEKLWESYSGPPEPSMIDCSFIINSRGDIFLQNIRFGERVLQEMNLFYNGLEMQYKEVHTKVQLTLRDNKLGIVRMRSDGGGTEFYHMGENMREGFFESTTKRSLTIYPDCSTRSIIYDRISYLGDLDGVFLVFEHICKWLLYRKTKVIWESESSWNCQDYGLPSMIVMRSDGRLVCTNEISQDDWLICSRAKSPVDIKASQKAVKAELLVDQDGLRMVLFSQDATESHYEAVEGTGSFRFLSKKPSLSINSDL